MSLEAEQASLMQRELFPELIQLLIQEDVYLETSLNTNAFKGLHPLSAKFLWEDAVLLSDNDLENEGNRGKGVREFRPLSPPVRGSGR
jgi:hypothetical protein